MKAFLNALDFTIEMTKRIRFCDKTSYNIMLNCALGREGGPSAPRVEHRYYVNNFINTLDYLPKIQ